MRSASVLTLAFLVAVSVAAAESEFVVGERDNIVVFGDSITADGTYAQIMQDLMDRKFADRQIRVLSRGASGDTVSRSLKRIDEDIVQCRSDWVLINLGINDLQMPVELFKKNYEVLINRIQRDTRARIGIISPIHIDRDDGDPAKQECFALALKNLAAKYNCLYIPAGESFKQLRTLLPPQVRYAADGAHANILGYWIFAQSILDALGYPFDGEEIPLSIPSRFVTADSSDSLAGVRFQVSLPNPLNVTLTPFTAVKVHVPKASKSITVDGCLDDWERRNPLVLGAPETRTVGVVSYGRDTFFSARAYFCYNKNWLYVAIEVDDSDVRNRPISGLGNRDFVELMLDLRAKEEKVAANDTLYGKETKHVCQYLLFPSSAEVPAPIPAVGAGDDRMLKGVLFATEPVLFSGYTMEFAVPAELFPEGAIRPGMQIGFDFTVNDLNRTDLFRSVIQWRASGSVRSFFSTQDFGVLVMAQ